MKKTVFILIVFFTTSKLSAQTFAGKSNNAVAGIAIPVGEFSKTHFGGVSLGYSWSHHRFGNLETLPKKLIGFTAEGSVDYYLGKKETVAGYRYKYGGYLYLHAFGGVICNPIKKATITLTTGPTMGIYKSSADIGFGLTLNGSYYLTNTIALTPGIVLFKFNRAAALWTAGLRIGYCF